MLSFLFIEGKNVEAQAYKEKEEDEQGENRVNTDSFYLFEIMFKHELTFV